MTALVSHPIVLGTTRVNVECSSFKTLVVNYKNGTSEYFMLSDVGNFYFGGQTLSLLEFFYYKRKGTGLIYPVNHGRRPGSGGRADGSQAFPRMRKAAQQGVDQVIIDGSTVGRTEEQVRAGIDKYEGLAGEMVAGESRVRNPKMRDLKTAFIVTGDGTIYIYHRVTSLKKAH